MSIQSTATSPLVKMRICSSVARLHHHFFVSLVAAICCASGRSGIACCSRIPNLILAAAHACSSFAALRGRIHPTSRSPPVPLFLHRSLPPQLAFGCSPCMHAAGSLLCGGPKPTSLPPAGAVLHCCLPNVRLAAALAGSLLCVRGGPIPGELSPVTGGPLYIDSAHAAIQYIPPLAGTLILLLISYISVTFWIISSPMHVPKRFEN